MIFSFGSSCADYFCFAQYRVSALAELPSIFPDERHY